MFNRNSVLAIALVLLSSCGGGGKTSTTDTLEQDSVLFDQAGDSQVTVGCETADDCVGKEQPGVCQEVACIDAKCQVVNSLPGSPCDDGKACTDNDSCQQGLCKGVDKTCSDNNDCTTDECLETTGKCEFTPNDSTCDDGNPCTTNDMCKSGACVGGDSVCTCSGDAECLKYDDADLCNGKVRCIEGSCQIDTDTVVLCNTNNVAACKQSLCDPMSGECVESNLMDESACSDGDACTTGDKCLKGVCKATPITCNDNNECTTDSCDKDDGCKFTPVSDNSECNDANLCTINDKCVNGECKGQTNPQCESCSTDADCAPFEDGNLCNGLLKCIAGSCQVNSDTIVVCPQNDNGCSIAKCEKTTGECVDENVLDGTACDDSNKCTSNDYCALGKCVGLPVECNDNSACTADSCDPTVGCVNAPKDGNCGDGDPCTKNDKCVNGECVGEPDPECQCSSKADCAAFEDDDKCNGTLKCVSNKCVVDPSTVKDCSTLEGLAACETAVCEPETGSCVKTPIADGGACNDNNACTDSDTCLQGICKGTERVCDDGILCTTDTCSTTIGCVYSYNNIECNDNNPCTLNDRCEQGDCTGDPNLECQCTADADCKSFDDFNLCNGTLKCINYKCQIDPDTVVTCKTEETNECTSTYCVPETGACVTAPFGNGKPCDDNNKCTLIDVCVDGTCKGSGELACADDNVCTDDTCKGDLGCVFVPNNKPCDDGDPCTEGDSCLDTLCQPGSTDVCGNTCVPDWTLACGGADTWNNSWSGSTDEVTTYSCSPDEYTGPEYTYIFTAPYDSTVTAALSGETAETDVLAIESMGEGCKATQCRAYGYSSVTVEMTAGQTYYFVVDGYEGGALSGIGDYTLTITCLPKTEISCDNGTDDDADGLVDCDDEADCLGTEACPIPQCTPSWQMACGETDRWGNYYSGSTNAVAEYSCNSYFYDGPEYTYVFVAPASKEVTFRLTDETAETDLMVLTPASDGSCLSANCSNWGMSEVTMNVEAGKTYYLVVDGWNSAQGTYTLTVECPPDFETVCDDELDNDEDGDTDCLDDDCAFDETCVQTCDPWWFGAENLQCGGTLAGTTDSWMASSQAEDYSCSVDVFNGPEMVYTFVAPYDADVTISLAAETAETDVFVISDLGDGCYTTNCLATGMSELTFAASEGATYYVIVDGFNGATGDYNISVECIPSFEANCSDGLDEDMDTLADCRDSDCFPSQTCPQCEPDPIAAAIITCDSMDSWKNDGAGSTNQIVSYSCNAYNYSGPEYTYTLTAPTSGNVTILLSNEVTLDGHPADLDIIVLADEGQGCNPASCIAYGLDEVTFFANAGVTYYISVDGYDGSVGSYDLNVNCQ